MAWSWICIIYVSDWINWGFTLRVRDWKWKKKIFFEVFLRSLLLQSGVTHGYLFKCTKIESNKSCYKGWSLVCPLLSRVLWQKSNRMERSPLFLSSNQRISPCNNQHVTDTENTMANLTLNPTNSVLQKGMIKQSSTIFVKYLDPGCNKFNSWKTYNWLSLLQAYRLSIYHNSSLITHSSDFHCSGAIRWK